MTRLAPCPACGRHVFVTEASCPFCQAAFDAAPSPTQGDWGKKIRRIGAIAAVTASLTACGGAMPEYGAPAEPDPTPDEDAGAVEDAGTTMDAGTVDAGDPGGGNADYGAPPEP